MQEYLQLLKLNLLNIGFASLDDTWDFDNVFSPFSRLYYITSGTAKVYHNNQEFYLKPNHMYLIPSNTYSRYKCDFYHEQYYISFLEEIGNGLSIYNFRNFKYEIEASTKDLQFFKRLLEINPERSLINSKPKSYDNQTAFQKFNKQNERLSTKRYLETKGILSVLFSKFIKDANNLSHTSKNENINKSIIYISENLNQKLTVKDLAAYCHLSKDHFSKSFEKNFGMRPIRYIQSKRIQRAQLLLLTTFDSLTEIAEKVGLDNMSYFIRIFKKFTGKTPSNFRKEELNM